MGFGGERHHEEQCRSGLPHSPRVGSQLCVEVVLAGVLVLMHLVGVAAAMLRAEVHSTARVEACGT